MARPFLCTNLKNPGKIIDSWPSWVARHNDRKRLMNLNRRNQIIGAVGAVILIVVVVVLFAGNNKADATEGNGQDKVGVCHRTASETNPYVYIEVPADEANGHITGTDKQHNEQVTWKSDGTWRGVPHKAGDLKLDYYASSAAECEDTVPTTPTETPSTPTETPSTPTETPSVPTETPSVTPPVETPAPNQPNGGGNQHGNDHEVVGEGKQVTECIDGQFVTSVDGEVISTSGTCDNETTQRSSNAPVVVSEEGL